MGLSTCTCLPVRRDRNPPSPGPRIPLGPVISTKDEKSPSSSPESAVSLRAVPSRSPSPLTQPFAYAARDSSRLSSCDTVRFSSRRGSAGLTSLQDSLLLSREIWEEAYNEVKKDEALRPLVLNYEQLFNTVAEGRMFASRRSSRQSTVLKENLQLECVGEVNSSEECFRRVAHEYMEVTRRDSHSTEQAIVGAAVQFIQRTKDAISAALASSPPASLAWTGICTILLPVCSPTP